MIVDFSQEEQLLFQRIAEGDEQAFRQLFEQYAQLLYPFLHGIVKSSWTAEEFVQETMLRLWLNRDKLPDIQHPRSWVFRIASNLAFTYLQRKLVEEKAINHLTTNFPGAQEGTEDIISLKKLKECLSHAVEQLPDQRKRIYKMSREQNLSRAEIAERLNISEKTVKNSINSALKFIREFLQQHGYLSSLLYFLS